MVGSSPGGRCAGTQASWSTGVRHDRGSVRGAGDRPRGVRTGDQVELAGRRVGSPGRTRPSSTFALRRGSRTRCSPQAQPSRPSGDIAIPITGPSKYWASFAMRVPSRVREPELSCFQIVLHGAVQPWVGRHGEGLTGGGDRQRDGADHQAGAGGRRGGRGGVMALQRRAADRGGDHRCRDDETGRTAHPSAAYPASYVIQQRIGRQRTGVGVQGFADPSIQVGHRSSSRSVNTSRSFSIAAWVFALRGSRSSSPSGPLSVLRFGRPGSAGRSRCAVGEAAPEGRTTVAGRGPGRRHPRPGVRRCGAHAGVSGSPTNPRTRVSTTGSATSNCGPPFGGCLPDSAP